MRTVLFALAACFPCCASAAIGEGRFPFVISELDPGSVANVSVYNRAPAGQEGSLILRDGRFYTADGARVRFLATNLTFASAFPDKALAPSIARRMASLGINCVRFHHLDNQYKPRGIWDPAYKDHRHMDAEQLDRLDFIIYQLKQQGIYTNLNLHVSRQFNEADGFENVAELPKYDKGVDNYEPRMIQLQREYAKDLLTHYNPYTQTRYVDEPCLAMVELNNENSLLQFAFGQTLHSLPEPYVGQLRGLWLGFLQDRYHNTENLRRAWDEGSKPPGEEMIRDPEFSDGTAQWVLESRHRQADVFEVVDDPQVGHALHARLNTLGVNSWDFQIHQVGHTLTEGELYTVRFKIKAAPPRTVTVGMRYDEPDWRSVGLSAPVQADGQWSEHVLTFKAREPRDGHNRLSFNCTNSLGDVWLAEVSLRPGGLRGLDPEQSLEDGTVAFPVANDTDRAREDWFSFAMELERKYTEGLYEYLKQDLGLKAPVIDTQASYGGLGGVLRESRLDYIDMHAYWQHPVFPGRSWDGSNWRIGNSPMTARLGADTLTHLAMHRVAGRAFTVSEYNHPAPNDYRAECMPMLAAFAGLQDWDGIFQFDYGTTPEQWEDARIGGYFTMVTDPAKLAFLPIAANLFRRGDVASAQMEVRLRVPRGEVARLLVEHGNSVTSAWSRAGVPRRAAVRHRVAVEWTEEGELWADEVELDEAAVTSDTGQVLWDNATEGEDRFLVDTEKTKVLLGHIAGKTVQVGELSFDIGETETGWAAVALTSMDDLPLDRSQRMLLVAMSKAENQDMGWDEGRTTVGTRWGKGPTVVEGVGMKVKFGAGRTLWTYPLDGRGARSGEPVVSAAGEVCPGPDNKTIWYELAAARG